MDSLKIKRLKDTKNSGIECQTDQMRRTNKKKNIYI